MSKIKVIFSLISNINITDRLQSLQNKAHLLHGLADAHMSHFRYTRMMKQVLSESNKSKEIKVLASQLVCLPCILYFPLQPERKTIKTKSQKGKQKYSDSREVQQKAG